MVQKAYLPLKPKLIRITTAAVTMNIILKGQLYFMSQYFDVIGITSNDALHFDNISRREGVRTIAIDIVRPISILKDLRALWQLYFIFKKEKPDIVHTQTPKAGLLGMMAAKLAGVKIRMHTVTGMPLMESTGIKRQILEITEKFTYACAQTVYPNSKGLHKFILENKFVSENKLKVLAHGASNGINTDFFKPDYIENSEIFKAKFRHSLGIQNEDFVFCFIGRFAREKGIAELIEATKQLIKEDFNVKLLLVGLFEEKYGQLHEAERNFIRNTSYVIHPGRADDVRPYYLVSDVLAFPSYREGFPNTVLEAGAMGLPAIVTDINGCNEIITHEFNGLIIKPKDSESLYSAMKRLVVNQELRNILQENARGLILEKYQNRIIWDSMKDEYRHKLKI
ncbi:MAG: glycosyltransferase family 4 protein [Saprospiraceae bacterium]|nr:glycosyltransferase family 4 protein [Saprospiraceae bacterium]